MAEPGPLEGEQSAYDARLQEYLDTRKRVKREGVSRRLLNTAAGMRGQPIESAGLTDAQRSRLRLDLIALLDSQRAIDASLKEQEMRYSYQTRTAQAGMIDTLGRIIQQDLQTRGGLEGNRMAQQMATEMNVYKALEREIGTVGFTHNKARSSRALQTEVNTFLSYMVPERGDNNIMVPQLFTNNDFQNSFLGAVAAQLKNLIPREKAIYVDMIKNDVGIDLYQEFGVRLNTEGVAEAGGRGTLFQNQAEAQATDITNSLGAAVLAKQAMLATDQEFDGYIEDIRENVHGYSTALSPVGRKAQVEMYKILEAQKTPFNTAMKNATTVAAAPGAAPEAETGAGAEAETGAGAGAEAETGADLTQSLSEQEIGKLIEELDNPNPSDAALRLKDSLMEDPAFLQTIEHYQDKEVGFQAKLKDFLYRKSQGAQQDEIARRKDVLGDPERHTAGDVFKARMGSIFGKRRTRWQHGQARRAAEAAEAAKVAAEVTSGNAAANTTTGSGDVGPTPEQKREDRKQKKADRKQGREQKRKQKKADRETMREVRQGDLSP